MSTVRRALIPSRLAHWALETAQVVGLRPAPQFDYAPKEFANVTKPYPTLLLFGAPGTGKGTQAQFLSQLTGHFHLSAGDIFRGLPPDSSLGTLQRQFVDKGLLIPDELAVEIWQHHTLDLIRKHCYHPDRQLLLADGMPRTPNQAQLLARTMSVKKIIALETSDEHCLIERLRKRAVEQGRVDDQNPQTLQRRLRVYKEQSRDVLQTFPRETIITIRADQRPFEVLRDILLSLSDLLRYPDSPIERGDRAHDGA